MVRIEEALKIAQEEIRKGMPALEGNVLVVQLMGARLITTRLRREVRNTLNAAVKAGKLGHIKKEGLKPEAYHHNGGRAYAIKLRNEAERKAKQVSNLFKVAHKDLQGPL